MTTRVLVTGAAGRVGAWVCRDLAEHGYELRAMVRPGGRQLAAPPVDVIEADLTDRTAIVAAVQDVDLVVHLAAQMPMLDTPVDDYYDINVGGTLRLLEAAASSGRVRRFVHASTDNTYGPARPETDLIDEDHRQRPGDYYGTSKVLCERLVENYQLIHGLEYTIVRLGSVIAPDEAPGLFRLSWLRSFFTAHTSAGARSNLWQLFRQCPDPVRALDEAVGDRDGDPAVDLTGPSGAPWAVHFTDVRDVVAGLRLALEHPAAANEAFNMVGPHTTTFSEGAAVVARLSGAEVIESRVPMTLAFALSNAKAGRMLGYRPRRTFEDTLAAAAAGVR
jgi:UDP-glucose 4-epimerase